VYYLHSDDHYQLNACNRSIITKGKEREGELTVKTRHLGPKWSSRNLIRTVCAVLVLVTSAQSGELCSRNIRMSTEWEPSGCSKPSEPNYYVSDLDSFNRVVDDYNLYVRNTEAYIQCIDADAADDFDMLKKILEESLSSNVAKIKNEMDSVKSSLEDQRP
jgi:hypothetical protein